MLPCDGFVPASTCMSKKTQRISHLQFSCLKKNVFCGRLGEPATPKTRHHLNDFHVEDEGRRLGSGSTLNRVPLAFYNSTHNTQLPSINRYTKQQAHSTSTKRHTIQHAVTQQKICHPTPTLPTGKLEPPASWDPSTLSGPSCPPMVHPPTPI